MHKINRIHYISYHAIQTRVRILIAIDLQLNTTNTKFTRSQLFLNSSNIMFYFVSVIS